MFLFSRHASLIPPNQGRFKLRKSHDKSPGNNQPNLSSQNQPKTPNPAPSQSKLGLENNKSESSLGNNKSGSSLENSKSAIKLAESSNTQADEELPDMSDPQVQQAGSFIAGRFKMRKTKAKPAQPTGSAGKAGPENAQKSKKEAQAGKAKSEQKVESKNNLEKPEENAQEGETDEMPDVSDPEVQKAGSFIAGRFKLRKSNPKPAKPAQASNNTDTVGSGSDHALKASKTSQINDRQEDASKQSSLNASDSKKTVAEKQNGCQNQNGGQQADSEEMPDITDPDVQKAGSFIAGRFKLRKKPQNKPVVSKSEAGKTVSQPECKDACNQLDSKSSSQLESKKFSQLESKKSSQLESKKISQSECKKLGQEQEEEMPNLNDPEVQKATSFMQVANQN